MAQSIVMNDAALQHNVRREIEWETCVPETTISVEVAQGLVTLSGTVDGDAAKVAAQKAAHRVRGVLDVVNNIVVQAPGDGLPSDAEIARSARRGLACAPLLPQQCIGMTVSAGWVTLDGEVDDQSQRDGAERVVLHIPGVQGISTRIMIASAPADAAEVHRAVEALLKQQGSQRVEGGGTRCAVPIVVTAEGGTVTLSGRVESWAEKRAVVGAAEHAPGVYAVVDHLCIESSEIES